jgi:hypothetical protein
MLLISSASMRASFASLMFRPPAAARTLAAHFGFMMHQLLLFLLAIVALLATVPLFGALVLGSWRSAIAYTRRFVVVLAGMCAASAVIAALITAAQ